jgi:hypothetical protein
MYKRVSVSKKKSLIISKNTALMSSPINIFFNVEFLNEKRFLTKPLKVNKFFWKALTQDTVVIKFPLVCSTVSNLFELQNIFPLIKNNTSTVKYYNIWVLPAVTNILGVFLVLNIFFILVLNYSFLGVVSMFSQCFLQKNIKI